MRTFDANFQAQLEAEIAFFALLLEFDFSITYYYNNSDIPIYYSNHLYLPISLGMGSVNISSALSVDRTTIELANAGLQMSSILLGEDVRNKTVILSFAAINSAREVIAAENIFTGLMDSWSVKEDKATLTVVNELVFWNKKALRMQSSSCPWMLVTDGSNECAYSGSESWCDKSYDRCNALSNTNSFGGFRFLPAISEREIWWGRKQGG